MDEFRKLPVELVVFEAIHQNSLVVLFPCGKDAVRLGKFAALLLFYGFHHWWDLFFAMANQLRAQPMLQAILFCSVADDEILLSCVQKVRNYPQFRRQTLGVLLKKVAPIRVNDDWILITQIVLNNLLPVPLVLHRVSANILFCLLELLFR